MKEKIFTNNSNPTVVNRGLMRRLAFMLMSLFMCVTVSAQSSKITVEGIVLDDMGEPLIGASVTEKGTTNGAMTDVDGMYKLSVPSNATLEVTYIGFMAQSVKIDGKTTINITMVEDGKILDEVVVTALGIKRDKKSLGYALQEVKGDALLETRDANVANALSGKIAGLQIKQSGTGPAGSSRIVLRGNNSIGGNNQPLVVVDGVPIDSSTGGSDDIWGNKSVDRGSGMADISPDDIETMSVLKGPAAAALYGSRAGNGVIMITTKTGKGTKGVGVSINTNLTFDAPMQSPKFQNTYGQGGSFQEKDAQGNAIGPVIYNKYVPNTASSWGEKMTGQTFKNHVGEDFRYSPYDNKLSDFTRTGTTWTNSAELTSATDKNSIRVAIMNMSNKAIVPNSNFDRTSATIRGTAQLTSKFSMDAKLTYINQKTKNRVKLGLDPDNIFGNYLMMPRSVHYNDMNRPETGYGYGYGSINTESGKNLEGLPIAWTDNYSGQIRNPYWAAQKNTNEDRKHRVIGFGTLKYEFTDWLSVQGRYGMDYTSSDYKMRQATNTPYWETGGDYQVTKETGYEINADFLVAFNKSFGKFGVYANMGGNTMYSRFESLWGTAGGLIKGDYFNLANGKGQRSKDVKTRKQINSLYGTASLSWDNMVYLDVTARNDWSSSLSPEKRSYFYPSVGASWLFTETLKKYDVNPSFIDYGKVRLSWAEVGNDVSAYQLLNYKNFEYDATSGESWITNDAMKALYDLKSEKIQSYEIGLEMKAFNGRIGLDFAYYNKDAKNQILKSNNPMATGYEFRYLNAGKVRNRGIELLLSGTPVQTKDFSWDVMLNYSRNKNKIVSLAEGVTTQVLSDPSMANMVSIVATEGGAYGDIMGKAYKRDGSGNIMINENGLPIFDSESVVLGNASPKWMGGITNSFRYKDFDLSFQIDMRYGGQVYMGSIKSATASGTLKMTEGGREGMVIPGVLADGSANTKVVMGQDYWGALGGGGEPWMYDATNIRLRELNIGYNLPKGLLSKTFVNSARISFVGRNLWMIHSKTKGFDPEAGFSTGNAQGFEYASMPTLRSLGFNINVTF